MTTVPAEQKRRLGCRGCLMTLAGIFLFFWIATWWFGPIRFLQFHASEIKDDYDDSGAGFTGDFTRKISARCTEEIFHRYAAQLGLHQRFLESHPSWLIYEKSFLPADLKGAYFNHAKVDYVQILAWSDGYLYYYIDSW
jgi:hypothetical protein